MTSGNFSRAATALSVPAFLREGEPCYSTHKVPGLQRFHICRPREMKQQQQMLTMLVLKRQSVA